jgi:uncharacterized protein YukE
MCHDAPGQPDQQGRLKRRVPLLQTRQPKAPPPRLFEGTTQNEYEGERAQVLRHAVQGQRPIDRLAEQLEDQADHAEKQDRQPEGVKPPAWGHAQVPDRPEPVLDRLASGVDDYRRRSCRAEYAEQEDNVAAPGERYRPQGPRDAVGKRDECDHRMSGDYGPGSGCALCRRHASRVPRAVPSQIGEFVQIPSDRSPKSPST